MNSNCCRVSTCLALTCLLLSAAILHAQTAAPPCGQAPPGRPLMRSMKPYASTPDDLQPFSKFTTPYFEYYQDLIEYNGAARDIPDPDLKTLDDVRIGFLAPLYDHPDQIFGNRMLNGATLAVDEANAAGGFCGKPFRIITHNDYDNWQNSKASQAGVARDAAIWGAAANDAVRMIYEDKVWAMFGSISSESTHIALRLTLKAETPLINSASTDPTIPETGIPWYFTDIQDDRVQGYTLARHIYTELGLKRIAILRVNDRYGRFGVVKFRDASRRLGHPVVIEQKFMPGDTDFRSQLQVIEDSRVDGIVLWTDVASAAAILQQMHELGMKQRAFGSHRTIGDELIKLAGPASEGFEAVFPYDPTRTDSRWQDFVTRYESRFHEKPDHFAALAYDAMNILLDSIRRAGLNRGRIRDALTGVESYRGVTGQMTFDPNCKNISSLFLASVHNGAIQYRRMPMAKPYATVGEDGVPYLGPSLPDAPSQQITIGIIGPHADEALKSPEVSHLVEEMTRDHHNVSLVPIPSEASWGKASNDLVNAVYHEHAVAIIATDRPSSHLAEQIGVKSFVPVIAISSDRMLTSTNIPWIFRLPEGTTLLQALQTLKEGIDRVGTNREALRHLLASGKALAGNRFAANGEPAPLAAKAVTGP